MADKLSSFSSVMQGLLVSLLFLGVNYYMWMSIRRIDGAERFSGYMRPVLRGDRCCSIIHTLSRRTSIPT